MEQNAVNLSCVEDTYAKLKELYDDDEIFQSISLVKEIERRIFSGEISYKEKCADDEEISEYERFRSNSLVSHIYADDELFTKCWDACKVIYTKEPDRTSNGIDTWFRYEEDVKTITICGRVHLEANIMKVLAVFAELDLLNISSFEELVKIEEYSLFRWVVRCRIKMPLTFRNRESVLVGYGTTIPDTRSVILPFKSIFNGYYGIPTPTVDANYEKLEVNYGFYLIKYIDDDLCELTSCFNVNPNISIIPIFVLNTFLKEVGYYVMRDFKATIEQSANTDLYNERMKLHKKFYDKVWKSINSETQH